MKPETIPGFDCLDFKRQVQDRIYEKIKDMTPAEEIAYFRRQAESGPFAELIARIPSDLNALGTGSRPVQSA